MRSDETPAPTPEQIANITAEIRRKWTREEERNRRVMNCSKRVQLREVSLNTALSSMPGHDRR